MSRFYRARPLPDPRTVRALSISDACTIYGPCRSKFYSMIKDGSLSDVRIGGGRYLLVAELEALLQPKEARV